MNDILDVKAGKTTSVFRQRGNDKLATDSGRCFSILTQKRSLDLQAKDGEERDRWVNGLRQIAHDAHWGGAAHSQSQPQLRHSPSHSQLGRPPFSQPHFPSSLQLLPPSSSSAPSPSSSASHPLSDFPVAQQRLVVTALAQQPWRQPATQPPQLPPLPYPQAQTQGHPLGAAHGQG